MNPPEGAPPAKSIVLPGALEIAWPVGGFCARRRARETGLGPQKAAYRLHLAVDEVATNVITHAYAREKAVQGSIHLHAQVDPDALRIHLEDTGRALRSHGAIPTRRTSTCRSRNAGSAALGHLSREAQRVDGFHYERRGDRNRVTFVVKRPARPGLNPSLSAHV